MTSSPRSRSSREGRSAGFTSEGIHRATSLAPLFYAQRWWRSAWPDPWQERLPKQGCPTASSGGAQAPASSGPDDAHTRRARSPPAPRCAATFFHRHELITRQVLWKPASVAQACASSSLIAATARSKARSRGSYDVALTPRNRARSSQRPTSPQRPGSQVASSTPKPR